MGATGIDDFGDSYQFETFAVGDEVTAKEGPFQGFDGTVIEVDLSLALAIVEIPLYGKQLRIPLRFHEFKKAEI